MTVERYRDAKDMPPPPRATGEDVVRRIREVMARATKLASPGCPPSVHRHWTLEEAQLARDAFVRARVLDSRGRRRG